MCAVVVGDGEAKMLKSSDIIHSQPRRRGLSLAQSNQKIARGGLPPEKLYYKVKVRGKVNYVGTFNNHYLGNASDLHYAMKFRSNGRRRQWH
jgi:hypothetical protein